MQRIVVKIGGRALCDEASIGRLCAAIVQLADGVLMIDGGRRQRAVVLVHGGGDAVSALSRQLDIEPLFVDGIRITALHEMGVVDMALGGEINTMLARRFRRYTERAVGISAASCTLLVGAPLICNKRMTATAGDVVCNPAILERLLPDYIPIVSPPAADEEGRPLNVNADVAALQIACALRADILLFLSDIRAVYDGVGEPMVSLNADVGEELIASGAVADGMVAKLRASFAGIDDGIGKIVIGHCDGATDLRQLCEGRVGTTIT